MGEVGHTARRSGSTTARILKALGIFGSLEMLGMLCSVVRTKLVALWIGGAGVGVISLYNSTIEMIRTFSQLNLRQTAVREIAAAPDGERRRALSGITLGLGFFIGLGGAVLVAALAPLLSLLTFDSYDYTWGFVALAATMIFTSVADSRRAVLQGTGRLRELARASLYSALASTVLALPLIYFFRMQGIVPVLVLFPALSLLFLTLPRIERAPMANRAEARAVRRGLISLGGYMSVAVGMGFMADYLLRVYINYAGGVEAVGHFQAGYTVVNTYVGMIFTAITMEFYPRLSASIRSRRATAAVTSHEIALTVWILMPVVAVFVCADRLMVDILYTESFYESLPYMSVAIIATPLRAASWCFSYVILARGDGRTYIVTEGISAVSLLAFSYAGWTLGGYAGLGTAYVCQYVVFLAATWAVCRRRYGLVLSKALPRVLLLSMAVGAGALALKVAGGWWLPAVAILPWLVPLCLWRVRKFLVRS